MRPVRSTASLKKFSFAITFEQIHPGYFKRSKVVEFLDCSFYNRCNLNLWGDIMKVSYKKLWVLCAEREMSKAELRKKAGLSSATFTKLRKNQEVNLSVLLKIADVMDCNAGDMMDFIRADLSTDAE